MGWLSKDNPSPDRKPKSSQSGDFSRRGLFRGARTVAKIVAVQATAEALAGGGTLMEVGKKGLGAGLDAIASYDEPVPSDLQQPTTFTSEGLNTVRSFGHSQMAGTRTNKPYIYRVKDNLQAEGLQVEATSEAVPGSTVNELGDQWNSAKRKGHVKPKKPGERRVEEIWTGGNEIDQDMVATMNSLQHNPWQRDKWGQLREGLDKLATNYRQQFTRHTTTIVEEDEADSLLAYGYPDLTEARRIGQTNVKTGESQTVMVGDTLAAKAVKAAAKRGMNRLNEELYQSVRDVRDATGVEATVVDPNHVITPDSFHHEKGPDDQHINNKTADDLARYRVKRRSRIRDNIR